MEEPVLVELSNEAVVKVNGVTAAGEEEVAARLP